MLRLHKGRIEMMTLRRVVSWRGGEAFLGGGTLRHSSGDSKAARSRRIIVAHIHLVRDTLPVYFDAARIRFPLSVTPPVSAKTRPVTLQPVVTVSLMSAR